MSIEAYRGFIAEGLASPDGQGGFQAHGLVRRSTLILLESDALCNCASSETAQYRGLLWARNVIEAIGTSFD